MQGNKGRRKRGHNDEFAQAREKARKEKALVDWTPKTDLGRLMIKGEISSLEQITEKNLPLLEHEVIDSLLPDLQEKLVEFRKTTRVTRQGRNFSFRASVLIGDYKCHVGIGIAKGRISIAAASELRAGFSSGFQQEDEKERI